MKAVNLIPQETRRTKLEAQSLKGTGPAVVGLLAVGLILVTMYVLASNSVSQRQAELTTLRQQVAQTQAQTGSLNRYMQFAQLAQSRVQTVREIASSRFDWAGALSALARVVPANTTLAQLTATDNSTAPAGSAGGASSAGALRGDINTPAFELVGCTASQDDVARLMSRLRLIPQVTRVTLANSVKDSGGAAGNASSSTGASTGCAAGAPTFDLLVFFQGVASAPPTTTPASTTAPAAPASSASPASTTTTTTSPPATPTASTASSTTSAASSTGGTQ